MDVVTAATTAAAHHAAMLRSMENPKSVTEIAIKAYVLQAYEVVLKYDHLFMGFNDSAKLQTASRLSQHLRLLLVARDPSSVLLEHSCSTLADVKVLVPEMSARDSNLFLHSLSAGIVCAVEHSTASYIFTDYIEALKPLDSMVSYLQGLLPPVVSSE
jgi:hypothetical protein